MYLTENGNILRTKDTANVEHDGFWSLKGQFLRLATPTEVSHLKDILPYVVYNRKDEPSWQEVTYWEFMWKIINTDHRDNTLGLWEYFTRLLSNGRREYIVIKWDEIPNDATTLNVYGMESAGYIGTNTSTKQVTIDELGVQCSLDQCLGAMSSVLLDEPDAQWACVLNAYSTLKGRILRLRALGIDRKITQRGAPIKGTNRKSLTFKR